MEGDSSDQLSPLLSADGLGAVVLVAGGDRGAGGGGAAPGAQRLAFRQLAPQLRHALLFLRRGGARVRGHTSRVDYCLLGVLLE